MSAPRKLLVVGGSGVVGQAALKHFSDIGWDVIGVSRRAPPGLEHVPRIAVDLTDAAACADAFGSLRGVTHVIYAAVYEKPGLVDGWRDREQMDTNLRMLQNVLEPLGTACPELEHISLLQGTKAYGIHLQDIAVPARERWPRHPHENFYWLHEDYLRARQPQSNWHWSILRPRVVFGDALGSNMNPLPAIGVYAALLKEDGLPLAFPGGPPRLYQATDADLLARACEWAATTPACREEIFNIANGDVFVWQNVWPTIADALGMAVGEPKPASLAQTMPPRAADWAALVRKHDLQSPADMTTFVGQGFAYCDFQFAYGKEAPVAPVLVSTIKARQHGFADCIDTEDMFRKWIGRYQARRWLPAP